MERVVVVAAAVVGVGVVEVVATAKKKTARRTTGSLGLFTVRGYLGGRGGRGGVLIRCLPLSFDD